MLFCLIRESALIRLEIFLHEYEQKVHEQEEQLQGGDGRRDGRRW
jgi:hypothetical protein